MSAPVAASAVPDTRAPRAIAREFDSLLAAGAQPCVAGQARRAPRRLFGWGYRPRYRVDLFDTRFYLCALRENPDLRYFVVWVLPAAERARSRPRLYARLFYKDVSLIWRSASHVVVDPLLGWIGKGDVVEAVEDGQTVLYSDEASTDLPLELQDALEALSRRPGRVVTDHLAPARVLRNAPPSRICAYADFCAPLRRAAADRARRVNGGRRVAWFRRAGDPASLVIARGYAPDFARGVVEHSVADSRLYGGRLARYRIVSENRRIQWLFVAGPAQAWIIPPQATDRELTSYGVRAVRVAIDEDVCVPGYEYHFLDVSSDPPVLVSQIPAGYAGANSPIDPARADASAWIDALPLMQAFRRTVLGGHTPKELRRSV